MSRPMRWFRLYAEAVDDEKLRLLAFEDRWHFVALLCCKAAGILDEGGPLLRAKLAVKLGLDKPALDEVARRLAEVGLIDSETFQPLRWDDRQFKSDDSTERVRAHRERMKRSRNVTVSAQETETETETETDRENARVREKSRSPTGSRIPDDFPAEAELDWCRTRRPDLDPAETAARFRDYWIAVPAAKGRKTDWPATWRNFVRTERAPRGPPRRSATESGLALAGLHRNEIIDVDTPLTTSRVD